METILIRHANSMGNARMTTDLNSDLTELGYKQAKATADFLYDYLDEEWLYGTILTSPFKRTFRTSSILAEKLGKSIEQNFHLKELIQEQAHFTEKSFPLVINERKEWVIKDMESDKECIDRLDFIIRKTEVIYTLDKIKTIIVTHGIPMQVLTELLLGNELEELPEWDNSIKNCCITHIKDGELLLDRHVEHLKEGDVFI